MELGLPTSLDVNGAKYKIRSDYRAALDIFAALADPELNSLEKGVALLEILYIDFSAMPTEHYGPAIKAAKIYLNGGEETSQQIKRPQVVDWEKDFKYIVAPINRVIGAEIRAIEYLHWWTFISAYYEIGDCTFAQIVRIRNQKAKGKPLNKTDAEWYRQNRDIVDIKTRYSEEEEKILEAWKV